MKRTSHHEQVEIIAAYQQDMVPAADLAVRYGVTRQAIYLILKRAGVDTRKRKLTVTCSQCGAEHMRPRCQIRARRHLFCDMDCYHAFLVAGRERNGDIFIANRHSGRLARAIVKQHFALELGHVVHHMDRNQYNNTLSNLVVFRNAGDHLRYHRGFDVEPIWEGSLDK